MNEKPVQQLRPTLVAYYISKHYGTKTQPLLVTFVNTKTGKVSSRRMVAL